MTAVIDVQLLREPVAYIAPDAPPGGGGECVFLGRTRRETHPQHGELIRLSYEAYHPLAERTLRDLAERAIQHYGCLFVRIHHAVGEVPPGEASVLVQVVCGHRAEAFAACRFLIDSLKKEAPIWKREVWADGTTWAEGTEVRGQKSDDANEALTSDRSSSVAANPLTSEGRGSC